MGGSRWLWRSACCKLRGASRCPLHAARWLHAKVSTPNTPVSTPSTLGVALLPVARGTLAARQSEYSEYPCEYSEYPRRRAARCTRHVGCTPCHALPRETANRYFWFRRRNQEAQQRVSWKQCAPLPPASAFAPPHSLDGMGPFGSCVRYPVEAGRLQRVSRPGRCMRHTPSLRAARRLATAPSRCRHASQRLRPNPCGTGSRHVSSE